ncbi:MAG TPA: glycosyltransferase family 1 protein [Gemmatimonadaceae bacterium]|jgi:glycosyltransferase involved in cell wall biosynthesis
MPHRSPSRIGIDARLVRYRRGIGNFVFHLLESLAESDTPHRFVLYVDRREALAKLPKDPRFTSRVIGPPVYPIWEQVSLPRAARRDRLDLLYCPANAAPLLLPRETRLVITIHDLMYLLPQRMLPRSPSMYQRAGRFYLRHVVPLVARRASYVTTVSECSKTDIVKWLGYEADRIAVLREAPGDAFRPMNDADADALLQRLGVARPFALALGAVDPRKNTRRIISAFTRMVRDGGVEGQLVISGLSPSAAEQFREYAQSLDIASRVVLLGFVAEAELLALYTRAWVLLYPSLYEGFGMPVLEAMACGTPVVGSVTGAIPEIAGNNALLVEPTDEAAIAAAARRLWVDPKLRQRLRDDGLARAASFSWPRVTSELLDVFERTLSPHLESAHSVPRGVRQ